MVLKRYIRAARLTDYYDSDTIHEFMSTCKGFGKFNHYQVLDDMMVKIVNVEKYDRIGPYGAVHEDETFYKFILTPDGLKAYKTQYGEKVGDPFLVKEN